MCSHQVNAFRSSLAASQQQDVDQLPPEQRSARRCQETVAAENPMLCCPLSKTLMKDPVTGSDGKTIYFFFIMCLRFRPCSASPELVQMPFFKWWSSGCAVYTHIEIAIFLKKIVSVLQRVTKSGGRVCSG